MLVATDSQLRSTTRFSSIRWCSAEAANMDLVRFPGPVVDWISGNMPVTCRSIEVVALDSAR